MKVTVGLEILLQQGDGGKAVAEWRRSGSVSHPQLPQREHPRMSLERYTQLLSQVSNAPQCTEAQLSKLTENLNSTFEYVMSEQNYLVHPSWLLFETIRNGIPEDFTWPKVEAGGDMSWLREAEEQLAAELAQRDQELKAAHSLQSQTDTRQQQSQASGFAAAETVSNSIHKFIAKRSDAYGVVVGDDDESILSSDSDSDEAHFDSQRFMAVLRGEYSSKPADEQQPDTDESEAEDEIDEGVLEAMVSYTYALSLERIYLLCTGKSGS